MDPNEHSPIARCIEAMQQKWQEATGPHPHYRLACWCIAPEEAALLNGFCKVESSPQGGLPERFVVLLTPFESQQSFSTHLLGHWLDGWEKAPPAGSPPEATEQMAAFRSQLEGGAPPDALLVELLAYVQQDAPNHPLVLGLIPRQVADFPAYNRWLIVLAGALPQGVKLMVADHRDQPQLKAALRQLGDDALRLEGGELGLRQALNQVAASGDATQPGVQFRHCLLGMGRAAEARHRAGLDEWGEKALRVAQASAQPSLMATARLVYAGFLMHFKAGEKIKALLAEGQQIAQTALTGGDAGCLPILLQLYGYQGAWHSMHSEWGLAAGWMAKQAQLALAHELLLPALTACRMAAHFYQKNGNEAPFAHYTALGYQTGQALDDPTLKSSDYGLLARDYYQQLLREEKAAEAGAVDARLRQLYGENWSQTLRPQSKGRLMLSPTL